jgi:hypothetical protein
MDQFGGCDNYKKRKPGSELQFYKWIVHDKILDKAYGKTPTTYE